MESKPSVNERCNSTAGNKLNTEKLKKTTEPVSTGRLEGITSTASDPMFHKNARLAAATESQLPRSRVPARSLNNKYRKIPKMMAPAECPSVLTSCNSCRLFMRARLGRRGRQ